MTKIEVDLNQFMRDNNLDANIVGYKYSLADSITNHSKVTLTSPERRRLVTDYAHYQLFDEHGLYYAEDVTLDELQFLLKLTVGRGIELQSDEVPDMAEIVDLVHEVNKMGLVVGGRRHKTGDIWQVTNDQLLVAALERGQKTEYDQIVPAKNEHGLSLVDLDYNEVLTQFDSDRLASLFDGEDMYEIRDAADKSVLTLIPRQLLGASLLCLIIGIMPSEIYQLLLQPRLSGDQVADSQITFERHHTSEFRPIKSVADLKIMSHLPIQYDDDHVEAMYRFFDFASGIPISHAVGSGQILPVLKIIFHGKYHFPQDAGRQLSDWLIQLANRENVAIKRFERRKVYRGLIDSFSVLNNEIVDVNMSSRQELLSSQLETVFNVIDYGIEKNLRHSLSFGELTTYLLKTAKKNGHHVFDDQRD